MSVYRDLHDELAICLEQIRARDRLRDQRDRTQLAMDDATERLETFGRIAAEADRDLARLRGISLQRLLATLMGDLGLRVDAERREFIAARMRYAEQHQRIVALEAELEELRAEVAALGDVDANYRGALQTKAQTLAAREDAEGRRVVELVERLAALRAAKAELAATARAGGLALVELEACRSGLGRLLDDDAKDLDRVARLAEVARRELGRFSAGLATLEPTLADFPPHAAPLRFTADFIDGLVVDWMAEGRGVHARGALDEIVADVRRALESLDSARLEIARRIDRQWKRFVAVVVAG